MIIVVSDTSPVLALEQVGLVHLLEKIADEILIPPAVVAELTKPPRQLKAVELARYPFLRMQAPKDQQLVCELRSVLDSGESEAIALAIERQISRVLVDEEMGRRVAKRYGLEPLGVLGVLATAKARGALSAIRPITESLTRDHGFFLAQRVVDQVLRTCGE